MRSSVLTGFVAVTTALGLAGAACPHGWENFRTSCYGFSTDKLSWAEAEEMCRASGASLVEVNTMEEDQFLKAAATRRHADAYWLGGTDEFEEGYWIWQSSGQEIAGFTDWYQGEPNNLLGGESCLLMSGLHQYHWIDAGCGTPAFFVCETAQSGAPVG